MTTQRWLFPALAALGLGATALPAPAVAQDPAPPKTEKAPATKKGGGGMFGNMVEALKKSPGCLGVETARTSSGKNVIFAWFENKKAATAWYQGNAHRRLMGMMGAEPKKDPMKGITDPDKPILTIATITPSEKPGIEGVPFPISQISIELYQPIPGGAAVNGTFAPKGLKVPGLDKDYEPGKKD